MRSNKISTTRFLLKRYLYIGVVVFLVAFFLLPFWGLSHIPNEKEGILYRNNTPYMDQELNRLATYAAFRDGVTLEGLTIVTGGLGFLAAVVLMSHLFSRRQCMLQFSLPDQRESDWLRRCVCYLALCAAPILLNQLILLAVIAANGLLPWLSWGPFLARCGLMLLINLYGFAMGMLASVLTGTYWSVLLAGGVLIAGAELFCVLWDYLASSYLHTYTSDLGRLLRNASPAYTLYKGFYQPERFMRLPALVVIPAALIISLLLYRSRRTETAERTLAFRPLHTIMGLLLPMLGGSLMGVVMQMSFLTEWSLYAGFLLGAALTFWLCRILFNQRICGVGKQWYLPAVAALLLFMVAGLLYTDAFGYDRFLPEREKLTAVSYFPIYNDNTEQITLTDPETLDAAYEWCALMRDEAETLPNGFEASGFADSNTRIILTYHMDGREVHRQYPNDTARTPAQPYLKTILESDDYCNGIISANHMEDVETEALYLSLHDPVLDLTVLQSKFGVYPEFNGLQRYAASDAIDLRIEAFKTDLRRRTFEEMCENPLFTLILQGTDEAKDYYGSYLNVYPGDENLLNAVFGDQTDAIVDYIRGGYAAEEDVTVLKVAYDVPRWQLQSGWDPDTGIESVQAAATPEEAARWVQDARSTNADRLYYMPSPDDEPGCRLYLYHRDEVETMASMVGYQVPEDPCEYIMNMQIPYYHVLDCVK